MPNDSLDRPALTKEAITPAMIEAGLDAYWSLDVEESGSEAVVRAVFSAMALAKLIDNRDDFIAKPRQA